MLFIYVLGDAREHQPNDGHGNQKDELLAEGHAAKADGDDRNTEQKSAPEDAPIDRSR